MIPWSLTLRDPVMFYSELWTLTTNDPIVFYTTCAVNLITSQQK